MDEAEEMMNTMVLFRKKKVLKPDSLLIPVESKAPEIQTSISASPIQVISLNSEKDFDLDESWEEVNSDRRKKKIMPKIEEEEVDLVDFSKAETQTYYLSQLIREQVCIHCMGTGKCREGDKTHSGVYFPDEIREYISNPNKMKSLDLFLKKNTPKDDQFRPFKISYSICLFNHCRKHCKHCRAGRSGIMKDEDGTEIWYCYPDLTRVQKNRYLMIGLHIDLELKMEKNGSHTGMWKSDHCRIVEEETETMLMTSMESPIVLGSSQWLEIAKKAPSPNALLSPASKSISEESFSSEKRPIQRSIRPRENTMPPIFEEMKKMIESQREMIEKLMNKTEMMEQSLIDMHVKLSDIQKENRDVREEFQYNQFYRDIRSLLKEGNQIVAEKIMKTHQYKYIVLGDHF